MPRKSQSGSQADNRRTTSGPRGRIGRLRSFLTETQIFIAGNRRSAAALLVVILIGLVTVAAIGLLKWRGNEQADSRTRFATGAQTAAGQVQSLLANATPALGASIEGAMARNVGLDQALAVGGQAWALDRKGKVIDSTGGGRLGSPIEARESVFAGTLGVSGLIRKPGGGRLIRLGIPRADGGRVAAVVATVPAEFLAGLVGSTIDELASSPGGQAALLGPDGRTLASAGLDRSGGAILSRASRSAPTGLVELAGTTHLYTSAQIGSTPWSAVLVAPEDEVLAAAGGPAGWLIWVVLGEFALAALLGVVLLRGMLREADSVDRANVALSERSALAEHATEAKSGFISTMAHEMRTPLAAVSMFAEAMRADAEEPLSASQRRRIDDIASGTRHVLDLLDDTADIDRVEAGRLELRPERLSVAATAIGVVDVMHPLALDRRIELTLEADGKLGEVFLDPARVRQVMINFLSNALKFTPAGGRVGMRVERRGPDSFLIAVDDSGIGVPADDMEGLFDAGGPTSSPLHGGDATRGLGLTVTRRLVEAMGGEVGIESVSGLGSTFFAILPRTSADRRGALGGSASAPSESPPPVL